MKKSVTLMEVLISLVIITVVMTASLKVQNESLSFYERMKNSLEQSSITAMGIFEKKEKPYLPDIFKFKDDDIDKELKEYKFKLEQEQVIKDSLEIPNTTSSVTTMKTNITLDEKTLKSFYTFQIEIE